MSSSTRFCSRLTSASCCSRFFFSSKSWLWIRIMSSCSCTRAFSSIRALRKIIQTCEIFSTASYSDKWDKPERRNITVTPGHWGWCHFISWLHHWKLSSCSLLISCSQKKIEEPSQWQPSCSAQDNYWNLAYTKHLSNSISISESTHLPLRRCLVSNKEGAVLGPTVSFNLFLTK